VKGIAHHLQQDEKRAIRFFERAADARGELNPRLTLFAYYWMGYSCNNVGQYAKATDVFAMAQHHVNQTSAVHLEVARLECESQFFELSSLYFRQETPLTTAQSSDAQRILHRLGALREEAVNRGLSATAQGIATTEGNINFWIARSEQDEGRNAAIDRAIEMYEIAGSSLWARFGLQEALLERDPEAAPNAAEYAELQSLANIQTERRAEQRSRTLLYLTMAICLIRQGKLNELPGTTQLLRQTFSDVDGSLTLYSQHWKTNVDRETFLEDDLRVVASAGQTRVDPATSAPTSG
jgi:hypothetical protein